MTLGIVVCFLPFTGGLIADNLQDQNSIVSVNANSDVSEVSAATTVAYQVKVAYTVKVKTKVWYKSKGKWKYKYVYKTVTKYKYVTKYKTVSSSTTTSSTTNCSTTSSTNTSTKSTSTVSPLTFKSTPSVGTSSKPATMAEKEQLMNLSGTSGLQTLATYLNKHMNHKDGASHTAAGVESTGYGSCWGLSDWSAKVLAANGYSVKVVQGPTSASARHRWLNVLVNGKWVSFEPSLVTKRYGSKSYSKTCGTATSVVATYNL
jgi:hypothetical protein